MRTILTILFIASIDAGYSQTTLKNDLVFVPKLEFDSSGVLKIIPSKTSSKKDFDFFKGKWKLHNRVLKLGTDGTKTWTEFEATQEMNTILQGIGNVDNFLAVREGKPFEGMTLRLFNPQTELWSIYWADSKYGVLYLPPVVGSFENNVGHFFSQDNMNGKKVVTVYRWDARDTEHPTWSQATSEDNGQHWEWNWYMYFTKTAKK